MQVIFLMVLCVFTRPDNVSPEAVGQDQIRSLNAGCLNDEVGVTSFVCKSHFILWSSSTLFKVDLVLSWRIPKCFIWETFPRSNHEVCSDPIQIVQWRG